MSNQKNFTALQAMYTRKSG